MPEVKVSVVMTIFNRADLLELTLRRYAAMPSSKSAELVVVDDQSTDNVAEVLQQWGAKAFAIVRHVRMDKTKSAIPVYHNNPALGINIGVRRATTEIIVKTDPECYPTCDIVERAQALFKRDRLLFAEISRGNKELNSRLKSWITTHPGKAPPTTVGEISGVIGEHWEAKFWSKAGRSELPYWFTALFSRSLFFEIGGVDERFLKGFAGEDDEWAERMRRCGAPYGWEPTFGVVHLWHTPPQDRGQTDPKFQERHEHNKSLIWEARQLNTKVANVGHEWGADSAITDYFEYTQP